MSWSVHKRRWCTDFSLHRGPYALQHIISVLKRMYRTLFLTGMKYCCTKWQRRWKFSIPSYSQNGSFYNSLVWRKNLKSFKWYMIWEEIPLRPHLCVNFLKITGGNILVITSLKLRFSILFWTLHTKGVWRARYRTLLCLITLVSSASGNVTWFQMLNFQQKSIQSYQRAHTMPV